MNQSLRFLIVILPILVLAFFAKVLLVDEDMKFSNFESKKFPSFELNDLNGDPVNARSLNGIKLVNVWASWCITCRVEHPYLMSLSKKGIPVVGLNYKDEKEDGLEWIERYGNPYKTILYDYKGTLAMDLGVTGAPETFLIIDGKIVVRYQGEVNELIWNDVFLPVIESKDIF